MTRAPLEESLERIPNHFELCAVASKRARQLARGAPSDIPYQGHKSTVQSLMEIASGRIGRDVLDEADPALPVTETRLFDEIEI